MGKDKRKRPVWEANRQPSCGRKIQFRFSRPQDGQPQASQTGRLRPDLSGVVYGPVYGMQS